jgi:4-hydroxy-4-methyl-2-oxoglutarate aldolase
VTPDERLSILLRYGTATVHEASGGHGALPRELRPVHPMAMAGCALPVYCAPGDNLALHEALDQAAAGEVVVATCGEAIEHGYWGEVMSVAAQARGVAGLVIDACVRDADRISELGFPVYSRGLCVRGTTKDPSAERSVGSAIWMGRVPVRRGDAVLADTDGVVVLPHETLDEVLEASTRRQAKEAEQLTRLRAGASTMDILGLRAKSGDVAARE